MGTILDAKCAQKAPPKRVIIRASPQAKGGIQARHERDHGLIQAPPAGAIRVNHAKIPTGAPKPKTRAASPTEVTEKTEVNT